MQRRARSGQYHPDDDDDDDCHDDDDDRHNDYDDEMFRVSATAGRGLGSSTPPGRTLTKPSPQGASHSQ